MSSVDEYSGEQASRSSSSSSSISQPPQTEYRPQNTHPPSKQTNNQHRPLTSSPNTTTPPTTVLPPRNSSSSKSHICTRAASHSQRRVERPPSTNSLTRGTLETNPCPNRRSCLHHIATFAIRAPSSESSSSKRSTAENKASGSSHAARLSTPAVSSLLHPAMRLANGMCDEGARERCSGADATGTGEALDAGREEWWASTAWTKGVWAFRCMLGRCGCCLASGGEVLVVSGWGERMRMWLRDDEVGFEMWASRKPRRYARANCRRRRI